LKIKKPKKPNFSGFLGLKKPKNVRFLKWDSTALVYITSAFRWQYWRRKIDERLCLRSKKTANGDSTQNIWC